MYYYDNNIIAHHGVLGMKWGVRHDRKSSGSSKKTSKIATVYTNAKQKHAAKVESKIQRKATRVAASYVNSELRKGTGLMGSEYVRKYAQERALSGKKGVTVATRASQVAGGALTGINVATVLSTAATGAVPVAALLVGSYAGTVAVGNKVLKKQQNIFDEAVSQIDGANVATSVDANIDSNYNRDRR